MATSSVAPERHVTLERSKLTSRFRYLVWALRRSLMFSAGDHNCPACKGIDHRIVRRKYFVTVLRECRNCGLRYRTPKDDPIKTEKFYVDEVYKQGFTTDLPSQAELEEMLATRFAGTEKDFAPRIEVLRAAGLEDGARVLDFGCSWGYGSWQLRLAGFDVYSYEIGRERALYAREMLRCETIKDLDGLKGMIDCFFSSHVVEHLPNPNLLFDYAQQTLRPGGLLVCYCPNGAVEREQRDSGNYHRNWGMVHPLMLTPPFLLGEARRRGFTNCAVFSSPFASNEIADLRPTHLDGDEMLLIARSAR